MGIGSHDVERELRGGRLAGLGGGFNGGKRGCYTLGKRLRLTEGNVDASDGVVRLAGSAA
jgi:hypothetical protein